MSMHAKNRLDIKTHSTIIVQLCRLLSSGSPSISRGADINIFEKLETKSGQNDLISFGNEKWANSLNFSPSHAFSLPAVRMNTGYQRQNLKAGRQVPV